VQEYELQHKKLQKELAQAQSTLVHREQRLSRCDETPKKKLQQQQADFHAAEVTKHEHDCWQCTLLGDPETALSTASSPNLYDLRSKSSQQQSMRLKRSKASSRKRVPSPQIQPRQGYAA